MKPIYKIYLRNGTDTRPRLYNTYEEALAAVHALRKQNRGYYLYEATGNQMRYLTGWEGVY